MLKELHEQRNGWLKLKEGVSKNAESDFKKVAKR
jgi:hypothetical protein